MDIDFPFDSAMRRIIRELDRIIRRLGRIKKATTDQFEEEITKGMIQRAQNLRSSCERGWAILRDGSDVDVDMFQ